MYDVPPIPPQQKLRELLLRHENRPNYIIAAKCGFHPARLSQYALGKRPIPPHHLIRLCEVLNCNPEDIVGDLDSNVY